ncbi:MAG: endonuclease/exonuclease/phosphatase family protein [Bacteroidales bacterium]|nr:endonuclease/exonuclease/phosphatase family protein [Bacteroidales bacterium]
MLRFFKRISAAALALGLLAACSSPAIKVMSFNVRNSSAQDGDNAWEMRRSATPAMIADQNPDVFGVQEALPDQEAYILEQCPKYKCYGIGRNDGIEGERMDVFYNTERIELVEKGTWWLSETPDVPSTGWDAKYPRTATWALLKDLKFGKEFYLVNTHLDHKGAQARRNGLAMVVDKIREMNPDVPLILMGDFNVEPGDSCLVDVDRLLLSARVCAKHSDDTPSFNGFRGPEKTIDYIYFSGFKGADDFAVVKKEYDGKPFISDHYPIVTTLKY